MLKTPYASASRLLLTFTLLSVAFPVKAQVTFPDVSRTHWAYQAVTQLYVSGILLGYPHEVVSPIDSPMVAWKSLLKAMRRHDHAAWERLLAPALQEALRTGRRPDALAHFAAQLPWPTYWRKQTLHRVELRIGQGSTELVLTFEETPQGWKVADMYLYW